jgi:hypothetical protein
MRYWIAGVSLTACLLPAPAAAVPEQHHSSHGAKTAAAPVAKADKKAMPDMGAMFALMDKMFPPQPDPDPARLALARSAVKAMWPDGSYGKMVTDMFGGAFDRAMQMKGSDFAAFDAKSAKAAAGSADPTLHDTLAAKDPYFDQRAAAIRAALEDEAGKLSAVVDPRMRDGLSRAMARRLNQQQLADVNAFFATPSGQAFAAQYMKLWLDPDAMRSLIDTTPEMMKLMPEMMQKVQAANDKFPKPPKAAAAAAPAKK